MIFFAKRQSQTTKKVEQTRVESYPINFNAIVLFGPFQERMCQVQLILPHDMAGSYSWSQLLSLRGWDFCSFISNVAAKLRINSPPKLTYPTYPLKIASWEDDLACWE